MFLPKIALIGAKGMLAQAVTKKAPAAYEIVPFDLPAFDLTDQVQVLNTIKELKPELIINCAAFTQVDACETQEVLASRVNGTAVGYLANAARAVGATLVHISTDYVFSGEGHTPLREDDQVGPQSAYGRSKLLGEQAIIASGLEKYFIVRTSWLYGPGGNNFVETIIRLATEREELRIVVDQFGTPTCTGDLAAAIFHLLALTHCPSPVPVPFGIYHFSNSGQCSWYAFAREIVRLAQEQGLPLKVRQVLPIDTVDYPLPAPRPANSVFTKDKYLTVTGVPVPEWQDSLKKYIEERIIYISDSVRL